MFLDKGEIVLKLDMGKTCGHRVKMEPHEMAVNSFTPLIHYKHIFFQKEFFNII